MFLTFDEIKGLGNDFIEFQFCTMSAGTEIKTILASNKIKKWKNTSMYVHATGLSDFNSEYKNVFTGAITNPKAKTSIAAHTEYFTADKIDGFIKKIKEKEPTEYYEILPWLEEAKEYIGFYIIKDY